MQMDTKVCVTCRQEKNISWFSKKKKGKYGGHSCCNSCRSDYFKDRRINNGEKVRAENKKARLKRREKAAQEDKARKLKKPETEKARYAARSAIKKGILVKSPCQQCGSTKYVQAHHSDYSKPLAVIWLCATHHRRLHVQLRKLDQAFSVLAA